MPKVQQAENLDKAAKIKILIASVALLVAACVLTTWMFDISLWPSSKPAAAAPLPPQVQAEQKKQIQEQKKAQEEQNAKHPHGVQAGS